MAVRAFIVVGLGFGDEGKGALVDFLARRYRMGDDGKQTIIIRYSGGAQCGHNVQLPDGRRHTFAQLGAGMLTGSKVITYLDRAVIIDPLALKREAASLSLKFDIARPLERLYVNDQCLITTPMHAALNRERAGAAGSTCGMGIGVAREYWMKYAGSALMAAETFDREGHDLAREKLECMRERMLGMAVTEKAYAAIRGFSPADFLSEIPDVHSLSWSDLGAFPGNGIAIFEGAQGVLLDERVGFHPYTTWSDVTPRNAYEMCRMGGWKIERSIGVTRSYLTRHGDGPFPAVEGFGDTDDPGNQPNEWQGSMRAAPLNLPLLKYSVDAIKALGYPVTEIAVSHCDWIKDGCKIVTSDTFLRDYKPVDPSLVAGRYDRQCLENQSMIGYRLERSDRLTATVRDAAALAFNIYKATGLGATITGYGPTADDWKDWKDWDDKAGK